MRVVITVEYDGTNYCGWQVQPNGVTVQQRIEEAIFSLTGEKTRVTGSGRTDAGVHALGQVAHFDTLSSVPPDRFADALNGLLPNDIRIISSHEAAEGFHARYGAKRKTYRYRMYVSDGIRPLLDRYAVPINFSPDLGAMREAAAIFVGEHDFRAFMASGSDVDGTHDIFGGSGAKRGVHRFHGVRQRIFI